MKQQLNGLPIRYKYFLSLLVIVLLSFGIFAAINTYYLTSDSKKTNGAFSDKDIGTDL